VARLVVLIGATIAALGVFGVARPHALFALVSGWRPGVLLATAAGVRVMLGVIFLLAAPRCRFPRTIRALGFVALGTAAVVLVLGALRLEAIVQWWFSQPGPFVECMYAATVLFGGFLVYSGSR
jgi:hypothetical protein